MEHVHNWVYVPVSIEDTPTFYLWKCECGQWSKDKKVGHLEESNMSDPIKGYGSHLEGGW